MAQRLPVRLAAIVRRMPRFVPLTAAALGVAVVAWAGAGAQQVARCQTGCLCHYCDSYDNGVCIVDGHPSGCTQGCVGMCVSDYSCLGADGVGGCGYLCGSCRDSDCIPQPTDEPTAPPPPPPPPPCDHTSEDYLVLEPIRILGWRFEPPHPTVIGQDTSGGRGFDIFTQAKGGWAELRRNEMVKVCDREDPLRPDVCLQWHWECEVHTKQHYDDPIVSVSVRMRLAASSAAWIDGYLNSRYYGAHQQEALPLNQRIWAGESMAVDAALRRYPASDPGDHEGEIVAVSKGTPLNPPQVIELPYSVPVYLLDVTIDR